jgi:hypothetical protein
MQDRRDTDVKTYKWVILILITIILAGAGSWFGTKGMADDVSAISIRVSENATLDAVQAAQIKALTDIAERIDAGLISVNEKLDTYILRTP